MRAASIAACQRISNPSWPPPTENRAIPQAATCGRVTPGTSYRTPLPTGRRLGDTPPQAFAGEFVGLVGRDFGRLGHRLPHDTAATGQAADAIVVAHRLSRQSVKSRALAKVTATAAIPRVWEQPRRAS